MNYLNRINRLKQLRKKPMWAWIFSILAVYYGISYVFLKNPTWLRPKKKYSNKVINDALQGKGIIHSSHRGGSRERLENTMEAFKLAKDVGSNMLELDVCVTKDKVVVVHHDVHLERTTGEMGTIHDYNYKELPGHRKRVMLDFSDEQYFDTENTKYTFMPKLEDVFEAFPDLLVHVELKDPSLENIDLLYNIIKKYKREDKTIWGVKFLKDARIMHHRYADINQFFTAESVMRVYYSYLLGYLPYIDLPESFISLPMYTEDYYTHRMYYAKNFSQRMANHAMFAVLRLFMAVSKPIFKHLQDRGIVVTYWVLNTPEEIETGLSYGVNGVMTDSPSLLTDILKKKGRLLPNK